MSMDHQSLPELVSHDVDAVTADRIRSRAHALLRHERARAANPTLARAARLYDRTLEPALVIGACVVYLAWAAERTLELMR